jgi:hypothetical protein
LGTLIFANNARMLKLGERMQMTVRKIAER